MLNVSSTMAIIGEMLSAIDCAPMNSIHIKTYPSFTPHTSTPYAPIGCPADLRTFASIEDGRRISPGTTILAPTPVFPKIESFANSAEAVSSPAVPAPSPGALAVDNTSSLSTEELTALITAKGAEIRDLKSRKADKAVVKISVDELLALKQR
jgi:WHEP-TRS domain